MLELWKRDPIECIRELIGNPLFRDVIHYAPEKLYVDAEGHQRMYGEAWTGDWWWNLQVSLCSQEQYNNAKLTYRLTCLAETLA